VADNNTPQMMDVHEVCLLYYEFMINVNHGYMADSSVPTVHLGEKND
jgi:hypothetical protein